MWSSAYAIYAQHSPSLSAGWCMLAMHVYYEIEKHLNYSIILCCLLLGQVELKSKHASELFELDVSQVFGKHISGIIVGWYPYNIYSLLFYQIAHIVESHINMLGALFLYWI